MKSWLRTLFAQKPTPPVRMTPRARLGVESLERRDVLSTTFNSATGVLTTYGTEWNDTIQVTRVADASGNSYLDRIQVTVNGWLEADLRLYKYSVDYHWYISNVTSLSID